MTEVVGIDVGGTQVKAARFSAAGEAVARATVATPSGPSVTAAVQQLARDLVTPSTAAVGVVVPGVLDRAAGVVRWSANLGWRDVPLRDLLADDLGRPVVLEHDNTASALAEHAALGADLFYVGLGTGIGAAYVVDAAPLRGATGLAGELGHVQVRPDGEPCACGQVGCLEVYASAAGVARRFAARGGRPGATAADVVAAQGIDPVATAVWSEAVDALGSALATATLLLDPARIVLGGGLAGAGEALTGPVASALAARLTWRPAPPVSVSRLGADAGVRGAALVARTRAVPLAGAARRLA